MYSQHHRFQIWNKGQHPYYHAASDIAFTSNVFGDQVATAQGALDWILAVLYPNVQDSVADVASLPSVGNTINDYRLVEDDGDGNPAGYRWEQREGDVAAKWYKIYDFDWSTDSILSAFQDKTQDMYVHKLGRDDYDDTGTALTGDDGGQHIYGGVSASTHLTLHANSGDGTGPQTGYVQFADNSRPLTDSSVTLGTNTYRWLNVFTDEARIGTLTLTDGSITDSSGAIDFGNETLTTSTTVTAGTLTIGGGSITDTSGAISFGNENLTTTGVVTANSVTAIGAASTFYTGTTIGTLTLADGSITDSGGTINFGDEILITTGTLSSGDTTVTRLDSDNIRLDGNTISVTNVDGSLNIVANGTGVVDIQSAMTTIGQTVTGTVSITGQLDADNLRLDGNTLFSTDVNGDIILDPNGTGRIQVNSLIWPDTDNSYDLGLTGNRFNDLFMAGNISDGTNAIAIATILSLRDILSGASVGMSIFYDGAKWNASIPDTEVDHGTITGILDDDHTQYALLAGRSGGQTLIGGTDASDNLLLESTSDATKGFIKFGDPLSPDADATHDIGEAALRFKDLYLSGEAIGLRAQNAATVATLPAASGSNTGRLAYVTGDKDLYLDTGGAWKQISPDTYYEEDAANWDGATASVTYDVSASCTNARKMVWQFKNNSDDYAVIQGAKISHPTSTQVKVLFSTGFEPAAGTYTLVGVGL